MVDIMDFLGGVPRPRRPGGLAPPHPASGQVPDILQILAESAADTGHRYSPGDPRVINNPNPQNVNPQDLADAALHMGISHGGHGSFPGLTRALIDALAEAHLRAMNAEARVQPSLAEMLQRNNPEPSMLNILQQAQPTSELSSFYGGMTPTANPNELIQRTAEMSQRLNGIGGLSNDAAGVDNMLNMAKQSPLDAVDEQAASQDAPDYLSNLHDLNNNLRYLALASGKVGRNDSAASQIINQVISNTPEPHREAMMNALASALQTSNIGSGNRIPGLDPASRRSLAPDINPSALGYGMMNEGQSVDSLPLLMHLMGLTRTMPKRGD